MDPFEKLSETGRWRIRRRWPLEISTRRHDRPAASNRRAKESPLKKKGGGRAGGWRGLGRGAPSSSIQTPSWSDEYKPSYFYAAQQLGRQSPTSAAGHVPYCVDVNTVPLLFFEYVSPQLVRSRSPGVEQLGTRSLFVGMSQPCQPAYDDADREMIHDGGAGGGLYEDGQVDDSELEVHAQQSETYT